MKTLLVAVEDANLGDQIRMAVKLFPGTRGRRVPRENLMDWIAEGFIADGIILDYQRDRYGNDGFVSELHRLVPDIPILVLTPSSEKAHLSRAKMDQEIASVITLPLDPHDLISRLERFLSDGMVGV